MSTTHGVNFKLSHSPSFAKAIGALVRMRIVTVWRVVRNRLAANRICDLDDRMLDDIGLSRRDLDLALTRSGALDDPTLILQKAARERARTRFSRPPRRS